MKQVIRRPRKGDKVVPRGSKGGARSAWGANQAGATCGHYVLTASTFPCLSDYTTRSAEMYFLLVDGDEGSRARNWSSQLC